MKELLFVCYPGCSTCKKALKWLEDNNVKFTLRDIKADNPTAAELEQWWRASGLPLRRFFNTSGLAYRALELKDKLPGMGDGEQLALLAVDGMLVKRPLLVGEKQVLVGFREEEWAKALKQRG